MSQAKANAKEVLQKLKSQSGASYSYHEDINDMAHSVILDL